jgi:hypothetical protein
MRPYLPARKQTELTAAPDGEPHRSSRDPVDKAAAIGLLT